MTYRTRGKSLGQINCRFLRFFRCRSSFCLQLFKQTKGACKPFSLSFGQPIHPQFFVNFLFRKAIHSHNAVGVDVRPRIVFGRPGGIGYGSMTVNGLLRGCNGNSLDQVFPGGKIPLV